MATQTNAQRNRAGRSHSGWINRPLDLSIFGDGHFTAVERVILSALYTFSLKDFCKFTYSELNIRYHCSGSSIYRTIKKTLQSGKFNRGDKKCLYAFADERKEDLLYVTIEEWLYFAAFAVGDKTSFLSRTETEVLSLLRDYHRRRWSTSQNAVADKLGISHSTASLAFARLKEMNLITATTATGDRQQRAANHHTRTFYRVNEKLLALKKREIVSRAKGKSDAVKAADELTDRRRYYARLRQLESDRLEDLEARLGKDYAELKRQLGILEMEIGKAEARAQEDKLKELRERREKIREAIRKKLEENGLTERDLEPHHICEKCGDTGILPDGTLCTCWKERRS